MSTALFATNNLNLFDRFLMHPSATSLSVQNTCLLTGISNSFLKRIDIFTESIAATNYILGMFMTFIGETQALPIIRLQ